MEGLVTESGRTLLSQGLLGSLLILSVIINGWLLNKWIKCAEGREQDVEKLTQSIERSTQSMTAMTTTTASLNQSVAALAHVIEALSKQTTTDDQRIRERLDPIASLLQTLHEKISETKHELANAITVAMGRNRGRG